MSYHAVALTVAFSLALGVIQEPVPAALPVGADGCDDRPVAPAHVFAGVAALAPAARLRARCCALRARCGSCAQRGTD